MTIAHAQRVMELPADAFGGAAQKCVALILAWHASPGGLYCEGHGRLGAMSGASRATVGRTLKKMTALGWLRVVNEPVPGQRIYAEMRLHLPDTAGITK